MIQRGNKIFPVLRTIQCFYWVTSMLQASAPDTKIPHIPKIPQPGHFNCCQLYGFPVPTLSWQVSFSQIKVKYPIRNETWLPNVSSISRGKNKKLFQDGKMNSALVCVFLLPSHKLNKLVKIYDTCDNPFSSFLLSSFSVCCPVLNSKVAQHVQEKYYFPFIFHFWTAAFCNLYLQFSTMTDGH